MRALILQAPAPGARTFELIERATHPISSQNQSSSLTGDVSLLTARTTSDTP
jgi:hypothetical protein